MKVFVTGATGYIGSAIVEELVEAGHEVVGLTRTAEKSAYLRELGARAVVGDLRDAGAFRDELESADALVHVAAEESSDREEVDRTAVAALLAAADAGGAQVLVYTSGCFVLGETGPEPADEDSSTEGAPEMVAWRPAQEARVLEAAGAGLTTAVIRPGMVYGGTEGAFASFFASAESGGAAEFVGDGANHWSPVYRGDVARLYRMVIEAQAGGIFHCAEEAALVGNLAVSASRAAGAGGETLRVRVEDARESMGDFADALTMDQVMGCARARDLGWKPEHPLFLESADEVFREWQARSP